MKSVTTALLVAMVCAPALAQDDPKPAPAGADAKTDVKTDAKKERNVDPAATKALERYVAMLHLPASAGLKAVAGKGSLDLKGTPVSVDPSWSVEKGFDVAISVGSLSDEIKADLTDKGVPAEAVTSDLLVTMIKQQIAFAGLNAAFEAPGKNWAHFDISSKQDGGDQVVQLTPFDSQADADSRTYVFGKDGLLKSSSMAPSANTPQGQQMKSMGITFSSTSTFEKKGERYVLASRTLAVMGQESETKFSYYDVGGGVYLIEAAVIAGADGEQTIKFHDYTVDGKLVESTKAAAEKPKSDEKPAPTPPAAPAPKDSPK